jgi:hypothetical protein
MERRTLTEGRCTIISTIPLRIIVACSKVPVLCCTDFGGRRVHRRYCFVGIPTKAAVYTNIIFELMYYINSFIQTALRLAVLYRWDECIVRGECLVVFMSAFVCLLTRKVRHAVMQIE